MIGLVCGGDDCLESPLTLSNRTSSPHGVEAPVYPGSRLLSKRNLIKVTNLLAVRQVGLGVPGLSVENELKALKGTLLTQTQCSCKNVS